MISCPYCTEETRDGCVECLSTGYLDVADNGPPTPVDRAALKQAVSRFADASDALQDAAETCGMDPRIIDADDVYEWAESYLGGAQFSPPPSQGVEINQLAQRSNRAASGVELFGSGGDDPVRQVNGASIQTGSEVGVHEARDEALVSADADNADRNDLASLGAGQCVTEKGDGVHGPAYQSDDEASTARPQAATPALADGGEAVTASEHRNSTKPLPDPSPDLREEVAREHVGNIRAFAQDAMDMGHDRATIGNLMGIRDECDKLLALYTRTGRGE